MAEDAVSTGAGAAAAGAPRPPHRPALPRLPPSPRRVAVLIETRPAAKLPSVLANFAAVLPADWRLQLFLSEAARAAAAAAPAVAPLLAVYYGAPFGVHKFVPYMTANQSEQLFRFCPEARVAAAPASP